MELLKSAKLVHAIKQRSLMIPKNVFPVCFGEMQSVFPTNLNLLYIL